MRRLRAWLVARYRVYKGVLAACRNRGYTIDVYDRHEDRVRKCSSPADFACGKTDRF